VRKRMMEKGRAPRARKAREGSHVEKLEEMSRKVRTFAEEVREERCRARAN
jgi:hypothetical protein